MNLSSTDDMIQEYCIYRGFVNSFRSIENERAHDKTKSFEAHMIVNQIFDYLHTGGIDHFISLWDFLNKRFFLHLDQEHCDMFAKMKSDLIKYYLVACVRSKNKTKLIEFFTNFSRDILSGGFESNNDLRKWYVLPYLDNPDHDKEFMMYFTPKWLDNLKTALFNYITLVLRSAPPPRLLLIDRWFRSESQLELRKSIENSACRLDACSNIIDTFQERVCGLHEVIAGLVKHIVGITPSKGGSQIRCLFNSSEQDDVLECLAECSEQTTALSAMNKETRFHGIIAKKYSHLFPIAPEDSMPSDNASKGSSLVSSEERLVDMLKKHLSPQTYRSREEDSVDDN